MTIPGALLLMAGAAAITIPWKEVSPLPVGVVGVAAGMSGSRMVVAGGTYWENDVKTWSSRADAYDPTANQWVPLAPLPMPLAYGAGLGGPGGLEIFGGNDGTVNQRQCLVLDPAGKSWRQNGSLPDDRLMAAAARVGRSTYLIGGCADANDLSTCADTVLVRDAAAAWQTAGKIPSGPVGLAAAIESGNKIWIFGGAYFDSAKKLIDRAEAWSFDPESRKWKALRPLPKAARGVVAVASGKSIVLMGGYGGGFFDTVLVYDTTKDTYTPASSMPLAVILPGVALDGRTIIVAGGEHRQKDRSPRVFLGALPPSVR